MESIDQSNSEKEPIHIPGSIQPFGFLIVLSENEYEIIQLSENVEDFLGVSVDEILGHPITSFLPFSKKTEFQRLILGLQNSNKQTIRLDLEYNKKISTFDVTVHRYKEALILEFERFSNHKLLSLINLEKITASKDLTQLCRVATEQLQEITEFDRVMFYRFDESWNGQVVAETLKNDTIDSYNGLWFPASDSPNQTRQIFYKTWIRMIPDVNYKPSRILPVINPMTGKLLDLSKSVLRSISPIHIEYLKNMKVQASLTIAIMRNEKLWGLIACHHNSPKYIPLDLRMSCEFIGKLVSSLIEAKELYEEFDYKQKLKRVHSNLLSYMGAEEDFVQGLIKHSPNLLDVTSSQGAAAAIYFDGQWASIGNVPPVHEINALVNWLHTYHPREEVWCTNQLPLLYPQFLNYKEIASGVLAITIPKSEQNYVLWFRPEVIQIVKWAGNPEMAFEITDGGKGLHPRKSFETWKQKVQNKSLPWKDCEIEAALTLRRALIEIDLQRQFERAQAQAESAKAASRTKEEVINIVSHDLKNPLGAIILNMTLMEKYVEKVHDENVKRGLVRSLDRVRHSSERMKRLVGDLLDLSKIESGEFPLQLDLDSAGNLIEDAYKMLEPLAHAKGLKLIKSFENSECPVECDHERILQVFSNLVGNAIKFTPEGGSIKMELQQCGDVSRFVVSDNGPGIAEDNLPYIFNRFWQAKNTARQGTGLGLAIAKGIVESHGGQIWVESKLGHGTSFYFTLPRERKDKSA